MRRKKKVSRPKNGEPCYYCGKQATQIDHVIPQSMLRQLALSTELITLEVIRNRALTVHSCRECNMLLSNSFNEGLNERKKMLKERLRKRYKNVLNIPKWEDEEIEELGYSLRTYVESSLYQKDIIKERLRW